jgi:hypothetical protein
MPDISMCSNRGCPLSKQCYRFMAIPNPGRQSYGNYEPVAKMSGTHCSGYVEIRPNDVVRQEEEGAPSHDQGS